MAPRPYSRSPHSVKARTVAILRVRSAVTAECRGDASGFGSQVGVPHLVSDVIPVRAALEEHALGEARSTPLIRGIGNLKLDGRGGHSNLRIRLPIIFDRSKFDQGQTDPRGERR